MSNQGISNLLRDVESALRKTLHRQDLDPTAREHLERALNHTLEACIAIKENGQARSVQQLVESLEKVSQIAKKVRRQDRPA